MAETIFDKIIRGDIPAEKLHEDPQCIAIRDIKPQAPVHLLVIPKQQITSLDQATEQDRELLGHLTWVAVQVAQKEGLAEKGYRLVWNCREFGGQEVYHIHLHVLGGRQMMWPPG